MATPRRPKKVKLKWETDTIRSALHGVNQTTWWSEHNGVKFRIEKQSWGKPFHATAIYGGEYAHLAPSKATLAEAKQLCIEYIERARG